MKKDFTPFLEKLQIKFNDLDLLRQVFVHRSYLNENIGFDLDHNERLEFLGDAVLELVVTDHLYKNYPNKPEGELTNWRSALVRGATLSDIAVELDMNSYLYLSRGEQKSEGKARQLILANAFEAFIGALYLDQGYDECRKFLETYLLVRLPEVIEKKLYIDPKTRLQELIQETENITPAYKVLSEYGPDHNKSFTMGVFVGDRLIGEGSGSSKQSAEQSAASNALERIQEN